MTPWDWVTDSVMPARVVALALAAFPSGPLAYLDLAAVQASVPPGQVAWLAPPNIDATGTLVTREVEVRFGPISLGTSGGTINGLALVDMAGGPALLGAFQLVQAVELVTPGAQVVISGPVVVTRQGG